MIDFTKKISFLSLLLSLMISFVSCRDYSDARLASDNLQNFFNDFETECGNSIWKNMHRVENNAAFSGNHVCECPANLTYALGFDFIIDDSVKNDNALIDIDMMIKSKSQLASKFVISVVRDGKTLFWQSFPLANGFVTENQWYKNSCSVNFPNDILKNSRLNCYVLNDVNESFLIDDFNFNIKYFNIPSYIDEVEEFEIPNKLKNVFNTKSVNILYSERENKIVLADEKNNVITKPLSLYYSLIVDNDTVEIQNSDFQKIGDEEKQEFRSLENREICDLLTASIVVSASDADNPNINFNLKTTFNKDVRVLKSSLIIPFLNDDFIIYRRNMFVDSCDYQDVYYLDNEGFTLNLTEKQLNIYHPDDVSSIQLDVRNAVAYINMDYYYDHLLMRYELLDTLDYYVDNSSAFVKKGGSQNSSFVVSLTDKTDLPRIMPIYGGYESAFIWTEHADWTDIKTHRATYFGSEDVVNADDAIGGFVYYDIPVTKSVFYNNPDSVTNFEKNSDFPGLHSTIKTDEAFFDFLKQLKHKGFDICLHTPEQYTSTKENLVEALAFMKENFASPSWIDHGYNNGISNNREDMVCDGLDSLSLYYVYDLWKENGVKFPFNASYEEMHPRPFVDYMFSNNLMRPYPGFGDALPLPRFGRHPSHPDILLWSTPYTLEPGENWGWNYYLSQENLDKLVDFRYVFITHIYAPWVTEERGFWEKENGKIIAKEGLNNSLERIANMREKHLLLPTTIADYMTYQWQLARLEYRINEDGSIMLKNNNNETIKGLSLISVSEMSLDNEKSFNKRKSHSGNECIIWFDMEPNEIVRVLNVNKN